MSTAPQDTDRTVRAARIAEKAIVMLGLVALARVVITLFFAPAGAAAQTVPGIVLLMLVPVGVAYVALRRDWPYARHAIAVASGIFAALGTSVALRVLLTIGKAPVEVIEAGYAALYTAEALLTLAAWVLLIVLCIAMIATIVPGGGRR
jgi:hypothetical protein